MTYVEQAFAMSAPVEFAVLKAFEHHAGGKFTITFLKAASYRPYMFSCLDGHYVEDSYQIIPDIGPLGFGLITSSVGRSRIIGFTVEAAPFLRRDAGWRYRRDWVRLVRVLPTNIVDLLSRVHGHSFEIAENQKGELCLLYRDRLDYVDMARRRNH